MSDKKDDKVEPKVTPRPSAAAPAGHGTNYPNRAMSAETSANFGERPFAFQPPAGYKTR